MKKHSNFDVLVTIIILLLISVLVGASLKALLSSEEGSNMAVPTPGFSQRETSNSTVTVSVAEASEAIVYKTTRLYGELVSSDAVNVYPSIAGKIVQYQVKIGQKVEIGQTIALVDASKPGATYTNSPVISPVAGILYSLDSVVGETVTTASVLATIRTSEKLKIQIDLPERYLSSIKDGMKAQFTTVPWPDRVYTAIVSNIGLSVDSSSRSVELDLLVDSEDNDLKSGMFVTVDLVTSLSDKTCTIPVEALSSYLDEHVVYVVNPDSTVSRRIVLVGISNDSIVEIIDGLSIGEKVVTAGTVADGTIVSIAQETKEVSL